MKFSDLGLGPDILRAVEDAGYSQPTPIQEQAIPVVLQGRDVLGGAQTGTGKTASFTLPMIEILAAGQPKARMPRSLILEPTRELASQVAENFVVYGKYHKLSAALVIGGVSFGDQDKLIDRGVDVLIATPGRLLDHVERGKILLRGVKVLVIDEADRMLDMGFIPDVERIVSLLSTMRQTLMFSATLPPEIRRLASAFLINPKEIRVAPPTSPAELVVQGLAVIAREDKREALRSLLRTQNVKNALIFCNRKRDVDILYRSLAKHGLDVRALHGDMDQFVRTETLEMFKAGKVALLVASDVAARGLDIQGLSHVFNFDVPTHAEDYIHRIGRTGRAGLPGKSFTLAEPDDAKFVTAIVDLIGREIPRVTIEGLEEVELVEGARGRARRPRGRKSAAPGKARSGAKPRRGGPPKGRTRKKEEQAARPAGGAEAAARPAEAADRPEAASRPAEAPAPRPARSARGPEAAPRPAKAPSPEPAKARKKGQGQGQGKSKAKEVGMGSHVPAFLQRPPPKRK